MKKFLRILGILILLLALVVLIMGLIAPNDIKMERSVTIKGPKQAVKGQMFRYEHFKNWSPWQELDPNMKTSITGDEGAVGTKYAWEGNDDVGAGEMTTTKIDENEKHYDMHFLKPWESKAEGYYRVEDAGNGETRATWGFTTHSSFPMNGIMMMMGMKKMLAKDFDKGLNKLKEYVESGKAGTGSDFMIQEVQYPGGTYATVRKTIGWSELEKFFGDAFGMLGQAAGQRIAGAPVSIIYVWDEQNMKTDVAAGFPVSGTDAVKGAEMVMMAPSAAYMIVYTGGYSGSVKAHEALSRHVKDNAKELNVVMEEYIKGPGEEPDSNKYVTNIYYLLK